VVTFRVGAPTPGEHTQGDALNRLAVLQENSTSFAELSYSARLAQLNLNVPIRVTVARAPTMQTCGTARLPYLMTATARIDTQLVVEMNAQCK
jgi:hypothetical protein